MLITNEYTTLVKKGEEAIIIKPNMKFDSIPAGRTVTAYATIKDESGSVVAILKPGAITENISSQSALQTAELSLRDLKEIAIDKGISYPSKIKKDELLELLGM